MTCPACGRPAPSVFPGATVACVCGLAIRGGPPISASLSARPKGRETGDRDAGSDEAGPYRRAAPAPAFDPHPVPCPYCGGECAPLVRTCPHCDVRLDRVRCARCYSLQPPGSFACARCAAPLELEVLLDATDAPCPRCRAHLEVAHDDVANVHECPRCGGTFVPADALASIVRSAEAGGPVSTLGRSEGEPGPLEEVKYLLCPQCHTTMNRVNFGRLSGVIVDVCREHGTWFDAGELTRIVSFAASGGLRRMRAREAEERSALRETRAPSPPGVVEVGDRSFETWRDWLALLLG